MPTNESGMRIQNRRFDLFKIENFHRQPDNVIIENNGHTLMIHLNYSDDKRPTISRGPVKSVGNFGFALMYFHWLEKWSPQYDFNGISLPAELHLVFYNTIYASWTDAWDRDNGFVIFAFRLQVSN